MNNNSDYVWKFKIEPNNESSNAMMEDSIAYILKLVLKYVVLTYNEAEVKVDGFKYIKDKGNDCLSYKISNDNIQ